MKPLNPLPVLWKRSISPKVRAFTLFALCMVLAMRTQATAAEPVTWPDHGPYRTVGEPNSGYQMKMPIQAIEAVQQTVPDNPSRWIIRPMQDFSGRGKRIVLITGNLKGYVCLLAEPQSWTNLSAPGSAPFLNEVLETLQPGGLKDRARVESYLVHVVELQKYGTCVILTRKFRHGHLSHERLIDGLATTERERVLRSPVAERFTREEIDSWLQGTEKSRRALLALCHDLVVTEEKDGHHVTVRGNVMGYTGAVEQWTLRLRVDQAVRLESIDIVKLRTEGTFSYPLVQ